MGFVLLFVAATVALTGAALLISASTLPEKGLFEVLAVTVLLTCATASTIVTYLAIANTFYASTTAALTLLLAILGCWYALQSPRRAALRERMAALRHAPAKLWREVFHEQEFTAYVLPIAVIAIATSIWIALWLPQWAWDSVWYHIPMATYLVQDHGSHVIATGNWPVATFPRNLENIAAWIMVLLQQKRWDGLSQIPFGILGLLVLSAWSRRLGASRPLSLAAGALFVLLPSVYLQLHTTQSNVSDGALLLAMVYFLSSPQVRGSDLVLMGVAGGMYLGTKAGSPFFLAMYSPLFIYQTVRVFRSPVHRAGAVKALSFALALIVLIGGHIWIRNAYVFGNPMYPVRVHVPILGITLPGTGEAADFTVARDVPFLQAPGAIKRIGTNWMDYTFRVPGEIWTDIRPGGLGPLMPYVLAPALGAMLLAFLARGLRRRRWEFQWALLPLVGLVNFMSPQAWWGRFTLPLSGAGLVAMATLMTMMRRPLRQVASAIVVLLAIHGYVNAVVGYHWIPAVFGTSEERALEEAHVRSENWLWDQPWVDLRERLPRGAVIVTDGDDFFFGEYWDYNFDNSVHEVLYQGDDLAYLDALVKLRPTWVSMRAGSRQEQLVREALGAALLFSPLPGNGPPHNVYAIPPEVFPPRGHEH